MGAREYLKISTDKTEAGKIIKENNLTEAVIKIMENYLKFITKKSKSSFVCGHPLNQTYLNNGIWHCDKCGGEWETISKKTK